MTLIFRIERLENSSGMGSIVLTLDYIIGMLVNLDVPDYIVTTMSTPYEALKYTCRLKRITVPTHKLTKVIMPSQIILALEEGHRSK